jgi:16S rRNA (guanine527-N7)-methyltransferase
MPRLATGANTIGVLLDAGQLQRFSSLAAELLAWNRTVNLTAIRGPAEVETRHFLDSLTALPLVLARAAGTQTRLVDVGTGAGLPGLALALAGPNLDVTLIDATAKKAAFVAHAIEALRIANAHLVVGRAEELARSDEHRERYDFAIARAIGTTALLVELLVPFIRVGGWALLMKKRSTVEGEVQRAAHALVQLEASVEETADTSVSGLLEDRAIVVVRKNGPTPARYPRRVGVAQRRPLDKM